MPRLTSREVSLLAELHPHTRGHVLQLLAKVPDLTITSGYRTAARNRAVGGAPQSGHLRGRAVDLTGTLTDLRKAERLCWSLRVGARCTGPEEVLLEDAGRPGMHLHVAW